MKYMMSLLASIALALSLVVPPAHAMHEGEEHHSSDDHHAETHDEGGSWGDVGIVQLAPVDDTAEEVAEEGVAEASVVDGSSDPEGVAEPLIVEEKAEEVLHGDDAGHHDSPKPAAHGSEDGHEDIDAASEQGEENAETGAEAHGDGHGAGHGTDHGDSHGEHHGDDHGGHEGHGIRADLEKGVNTLIVFLVLGLLLTKPISNFMANRRQGIETDIDEARAAKQSAAGELQQQEIAVRNTESELQSFLVEGRSLAEKEQALIKERASEEAKKIEESAKQRIQREEQKARQDLTHYVVRLATQRVEEKLSGERSDTMHRDLIMKMDLVRADKEMVQ